jgi:hypothetical protein
MHGNISKAAVHAAYSLCVCSADLLITIWRDAVMFDLGLRNAHASAIANDFNMLVL